MKDANFKTKYDVAVVGGGASGMVAACFCAARGRKVCILEKNKKLGRKLSVTGNGKCNLTNYSMGAEYYFGGAGQKYTTFVENLLLEYGTVEILEFFNSIGIICKDKNGYLYPISEQAQSVSGALEAELRRLKVDVLFEQDVKNISAQTDGSFIIDAGGIYSADKVILACGSPAAPVYGASGFGYEMLKKMGHKVTEPLPALCPLTVYDKIVKSLAGVRLEANIEVSLGGEKHWEKGEIIFNADNVSGIPVFQLSRFVSRYFENNASKGSASAKQGAGGASGSPVIKIDLIPLLTEKELADSVWQLVCRNPKLTVEYLFRGVLNNKAVYYILKENGFDPEQPAENLKKNNIDRMVSCFKNFRLTITGTKGFENSQVSTGGLALDEVDEKTLESKRVKGLFVTGELLDIDGICGGYNLHFAFSTGMRAGKAASVKSPVCSKGGSL